MKSRHLLHGAMVFYGAVILASPSQLAAECYISGFPDGALKAQGGEPLLTSVHYAAWMNGSQPRVFLSDAIDQKTAELTFDRRAPGDLVPLGVNIGFERDSDIFDGVNYGIKKADGGFMQITLGQGGVPEQIVWFDDELTRLQSTNLVQPTAPNGLLIESLVEQNDILALFDWLPVSNQFFAYGALGLGGKVDEFTNGFFTTSLESLGGKDALPRAELVMNFPDFDYYVLNHPYIAADGDTAYFLALAEGVQAELLSFNTLTDVRPTVLNGYPGSGAAGDGLPKIERRAIHEMYEQVESLAMPVGLFSNGDGLLFALHREPLGQRESRWTLYTLRPDPRSESVEILGATVLPTQRETRHVILVPAESSWVLLELGRVGENRRRPPIGIVTFPHSWVKNPSGSFQRSSCSPMPLDRTP